MKCQDFRELIDSYLSDELLTETNHDVLRHLEQCADCRKTIESRRIFRTRLRVAVMNAPEFQMPNEFYSNLHDNLKRNFLPKTQEKNSFWANNKFQFALAACLLVVVAFGFLIVQNLNNNNSRTEIAVADNAQQSAYFQRIAVGDHQNCAVNFNLAEPPVEINLASPEYADLRQGVLMPLQNASNKYKLDESHNCKYQNQEFTHLVFRHEGKLISVLMMNAPDYNLPENRKIIKSAENGYQIAHFDVTNKAFFVISDLPEKENSATAQILQNQLQKQFANVRQSSLISQISFRR